MKQKILEVNNLFKQYGNILALDNASFEVCEGEIFGLIGPNGAGKTTAMKIICGLIQANHGEVKILNFNIVHDYVKAIKNVGAIIETPNLYGYLTGFENLKYLADISGITNSGDRINKLAKLVGLEGRINSRVREYSMGMKQRLGIAQALLNSPRLLILDEPFSALDTNGVLEMREFLKTIVKEEKIAVLISSHNLYEIEMLCDKIALIDNGRIIQNKNKEEFTNKNGKYKIKVSHPNFAAKLINIVFKVNNIEVIKNEVVLPASESEIQKYLKVLIKKGISVFGVAPLENSLENVYLEMLNVDKKNNQGGKNEQQ